MDTPRKRVRELGISPGILPVGKLNAITDVPGVKADHVTLVEGDDIRTGVAAILPYAGNIFQEKVSAGLAVGNGFGKLMGFTGVLQIDGSPVGRRLAQYFFRKSLKTLKALSMARS